LYVLVRRDLPLAHQAVQAIHAGISSARELIPGDAIHPSLVLCTVPDKGSLLAMQDRCHAAGIANRVFVESDMGDEPTALATQPVNGKGRRLFRDLPLFTGE
jgi:hypothetical protein